MLKPIHKNTTASLLPMAVALTITICALEVWAAHGLCGFSLPLPTPRFPGCYPKQRPPGLGNVSNQGLPAQMQHQSSGPKLWFVNQLQSTHSSLRVTHKLQESQQTTMLVFMVEPYQTGVIRRESEEEKHNIRPRSQNPTWMLQTL